MQLAEAEAAWKLPIMQLKHSDRAICTETDTAVVPPPISFKYLPARQLTHRLKSLCAFVEAVSEAKIPLVHVLSVKYLPEGHILQFDAAQTFRRSDVQRSGYSRRSATGII